MGEAPELKNFYVAAGFNSIGIASGGGAGRALAEWIVQGEPTLDLWPVDIRRFAPFHNDDRFLKARVSEVLGLHYMMPWPNRELQSARPLRTRRSMSGSRRSTHCSVQRWAGSGRTSLRRRPWRRGSTIQWERQNWFALCARQSTGDARRGDGSPTSPRFQVLAARP
jgi:4-methylaminobutanoate oxidase (formaldehyde-forming)